MQRNGALKLLDEMRDENDDESLRQSNLLAPVQTILGQNNYLCDDERFLTHHYCFITYQYHFSIKQKYIHYGTLRS